MNLIDLLIDNFVLIFFGIKKQSVSLKFKNNNSKYLFSYLVTVGNWKISSFINNCRQQYFLAIHQSSAFTTRWHSCRWVSLHFQLNVTTRHKSITLVWQSKARLFVYWTHVFGIRKAHVYWQVPRLWYTTT